MPTAVSAVTMNVGRCVQHQKVIAAGRDGEGKRKEERGRRRDEGGERKEDRGGRERKEERGGGERRKREEEERRRREEGRERRLFILLPWYPPHSHSRGDVPLGTLVGRACSDQRIKLDIQALASKDTRLHEGKTKH